MEHGYPLRLGPEHMKIAVDSGLWPLFRFDPRRIKDGQNPLQLDSKEPSIGVGEFMRQERRFMSLAQDNLDVAKQLVAEAQEGITRNYQYLTKLSTLPFDQPAGQTDTTSAAE